MKDGLFRVLRGNDKCNRFYLIQDTIIRRDGYIYFPFKESIYYPNTRRRYGIGVSNESVVLFEWLIEHPEYYVDMPFSEEELDDLEWSLYFNPMDRFHSNDMERCILRILLGDIKHPYSKEACNEYEKMGLSPKHVQKNWTSYQKHISMELADIFY